MSAEIQVRASLVFHKGVSQDGLVFSGDFTFTGTAHLKAEQSIGFAAEEALVLGEVGAGGWLIILNLDAANFVSVRAAAAATPPIKVPALGIALFMLHPSATAPTVQADTAAVKIKYLLLAP